MNKLILTALVIKYPASLREGHLCRLKKGSCPGLWQSDSIHQSRETHAGSLPGNEGWTGQTFSKLTTAALSRANLPAADEAEAGAGAEAEDGGAGGAVADPSISFKLLIPLHSCQSPMEKRSALHPQMTHSRPR